MSRIAHITDVHLEHKFPKNFGVDACQNWELLLADIKSKKLDFIVFGGDIGETSIFPYFIDTLAHTKIPYHIVLGNHDKLEELKPFLTNFSSENNNEWYYSFQDEKNHFFVLDSSIGSISLMQQKWFIKQINSSDKKIITFVHHPFLAVPTRVDIDFPLLKRNKLVKKLNQLSNEITLICGHYHTDSFISQHNINQYITPSAAIQILQNTDTIEVNPNEFGYRIIEFDGEKIKTEVIIFKI